MFERFTPQARTAVVLAQEEARALGHPYIGTEHLLLALLADAASAAAQVLTALGADQAKVREEILAIVGPGKGAPSGHIPFTPRAKKVLELSLREALALKHRTIAGEHILLGLVREGEGLAAMILTKHGVELELVRRQVIDRLGGEQGRRGRSRRVPDPRFSSMTPGGAKAADRAVARAGHQPVASHHYLLGLLDDEDSAAAKALTALGVTKDVVEAKLAEIGTAGTTDDPPGREVASRTRLSVEGEAVRVELLEPNLARRLQPYVTRPLTDLPGMQAVWAATVPALTNLASQLEVLPALSTPGWTESGLAALAVTSVPGGPTVRLWIRPGEDAQAVAAWLADWLREREAVGVFAGEGTYVTVTLDDGPRLSGLSYGVAPGAGDVPRLSVSELVGAAITTIGPPR